MQRLLLVSSSSVAGTGYLDHCEEQVRSHFSGADPVQYECQRNFVLLMTDGRPQGEGNDTTADLSDFAGGPLPFTSPPAFKVRQ